MFRAVILAALIAVILVISTVAIGVWHFGMIKSKGIPLGPAVRLPGHIGLIIRTTEPYLPTLHRNPDNDRYCIDLLVISLTDPPKQETINLLHKQERNALQPMTKILGGTGDIVWVQALDLFAVNLKTKRVVSSSDIIQLNPKLAVFFNSAHFEFKDRLIAVADDQQEAYAIDDITFKTKPVPVPRSVAWVNPNAAPESLLCAGGLLTPNEWLGVLTAKDLARDFKSGSSVPRDSPLNPNDELRRLYRGRLDSSATRPRIKSMESIGEVTYQNGALIRSAEGPSLLRLTAPDSVLLTHRSSIGSTGTLLVSRLEPNGKTSWTADTGIGILQQVLPGEKFTAFIGTRPAIPEKLPEPILVIVNTDAGGMTAHSLWR